MHNQWFYVKDSADFLSKIRSLSRVPSDSLFVMRYLVGLYPRLLYSADLIALRLALEERKEKQIPTGDLFKLGGFVLTSSYFEFLCWVFQQISGTVTGFKFEPPFAFLSKVKVEREILESLHYKVLISF